MKSEENRKEILHQIEALASSIGVSVAIRPDAPAPERQRKKRPGKKKARTFRMTDRDLEIIKAVNRYRYLRTGQIKRLFFSENTTKQSAQKRLRNLSDERYGYLRRIHPYIQMEKNETGFDHAFFIGPAGGELLQEIGEPISPYAHKNSGLVKHHFLDHALDISEFRLKLELAFRGHPQVELHRFTADFELKGSASRSIGKKAFKLYQPVSHPHTRKTFVVYPDAMIILRGKGDLSEQQKLFFLEIDRGTERLQQIREKVIGYHVYADQKAYRKFGKFSGFRVLFQTNSKKRAENMWNALDGTEGRNLAWITDDSRVGQETILHSRIWRDWKGNFRSILLRKTG